MIAILFANCTAEKWQTKPVAIGKPNELVIVWDSTKLPRSLQDSIRKWFERPYIITPQVEPLYDLFWFSPRQMESDYYKRTLRSYLIILPLRDTTEDLSRFVRKYLSEKLLIPENKPYRLRKIIDPWAKGQLVLVLKSRDILSAREGFLKLKRKIIEKITSHDAKIIEAGIYAQGKNPILTKTIDSMFHLEMIVPEGYKIAVKRNKVLWLRRDLKEGMQSLILWEMPYRDTSQLFIPGLIDAFNDMGYMIKTDIPGDRVVVDNENFPVFRYVNHAGDHYTVELRGIWMTLKDFFGGPFVLRVVVLPEKRKLLYMAGLVWAPAQDKRNLIQQLHYLINKAGIER